MIIEHEHVISNHFGVYYVSSKILKKFWICSGISTVCKYLSNCQHCKLRRAKSAEQVMGDLLECRRTIPLICFEYIL